MRIIINLPHRQNMTQEIQLAPAFHPKDHSAMVLHKYSGVTVRYSSPLHPPDMSNESHHVEVKDPSDSSHQQDLQATRTRRSSRLDAKTKLVA
jgi:hypothetical protein